jgi:long-chain fatty acid transport protein
MGRAGAFVAGADDLGAVWYNPAGLVDAGTSALVDFGWLRFGIRYVRQLRIEDHGVVTYPSSARVEGRSPVLPMPTVAGSYALDEEKNVVAAVGLIAPYVALASYPLEVEGEPSPARYTLGSFSGSLLVIPGAWLAFRPHPMLRIGGGFSALTGYFQSTVTFSASLQDRVLGAPEQPEYDAASQMRVGPIFAPTGQLGGILEPSKHIRLGASFQLPTWIDADATIQVRLPSAVVFDGARVTGQQARVRFALPAILRLAAEVRPLDSLRMEIAYVREYWSIHDTIDIYPQDIAVEGILGGPDRVSFPTITIPRHFQDAHSVRFGSEYAFPVHDMRVGLRAGYARETSAVPAEYLSLSSLDFQKHIVTAGASLYLDEHWRLDAVYGRLVAESTDVAPDAGRIPRINPFSGNAAFEPVNGGSYEAGADLIGLGAEYRK